jgi:hypothetical protein
MLDGTHPHKLQPTYPVLQWLLSNSTLESYREMNHEIERAY